MTMAYADRTGAHDALLGPTWATEADMASERRVASVLQDAWRCDVVPFGRLCPVDWYILRDQRIVAVAELKTRSHSVGAYPTVWLNVRKWLALRTASLGLGVPALFVACWTDDLRWIDSGAIDARSMRMGGCRTRVKSHTDIEPVIEVPVADMRTIGPRAALGAGPKDL